MKKLFLLLLIPFTLNAEPLTSKDMKTGVSVIRHQLEPVFKQFNIENKYLFKLLKQVEKLKINNLYPDAITFGIMARCQQGLGACVATQINLAKERGEWIVSVYSLLGLQAGFAEMLKIELYLAVCYGTCIGENGSGLFMGIDGMAAVGVGGGFFFDVGVDLTDAWAGKYEGNNIKEILKTSTVYSGWGLDIGQGVGTSIGLYYYKHNYTFRNLTTHDLYTMSFIQF